MIFKNIKTNRIDSVKIIGKYEDKYSINFDLAGRYKSGTRFRYTIYFSKEKDKSDIREFKMKMQLPTI